MRQPAGGSGRLLSRGRPARFSSAALPAGLRHRASLARSRIGSRNMVRRLETAARVHRRRQGRALVRRATVGFVTDSLTEPYQFSLLRGAIAAARDRRVNLVVYSAGVPDAVPPRHALPGVGSVDALVVTANTMAYRVGLDGIAQYCDNLGTQPACFVGAQVGDRPSVLTDNAHGMAQAVRHLIRVHSKQRVAFIGGPPGHNEADERLQAYRGALTEGGLEPVEELVAHGDFVRHSGARAMAELLSRGVEPDAVVAANDEMAFGALEALRERGLSVPEDVALVGFDDVEEGRFTSPALTSVRQPLEQQGREAVRLAVEMLDRGSDAESLTLPLELVARSSCGCGTEMSGLSAGTQQLSGAFELAFQQRRPVILAEMSRAGQATLGRVSANWRERLLRALVDDLRGLTHASFLVALRDELDSSRSSGGRLGGWQRVLTVLRREARTCLHDELRLLAFLEETLHQARQMVGVEMQNQQAMRRMHVEHWMAALRVSSSELNAVSDVDALLAVLVDHLDRLGFRRAYLALHNDDPSSSRLVLGYDRDLPLEGVAVAQVFPSDQLTPPDLRTNDDAMVWVTLPLRVGDQQLGWLLLDHGPGEAMVWETIREQTAVALRFCLLLAECQG